MITKLNLPHWSKVLLAVHGMKDKERYTQRLFRRVPIASSHIRNVVLVMETAGYIEKSKGKDGRVKEIRLTIKGVQIAKDVLKLKQDMKRSPLFFENNETVHTRTF